MKKKKGVLGKSLLFIGIILLFCVLAASIAGAVGCFSLNAYDYSRKDFIEKHQNDYLGIMAGNIGGYEFGRPSEYSTVNYFEYYHENTNLLYYTEDENGECAGRNTELGPDSQRWRSIYYYDKDARSTPVARFETDEAAAENGYTCKVYIAVDEDLPVHDSLYLIAHWGGLLYDLRYVVYIAGVVAVAGIVTCFIALMCASGRRKGVEEIVPGHLNIVPFDILLAAAVLIEVGLAYLIHMKVISPGYGSLSYDLGMQYPVRVEVLQGIIIGLYVLFSLCVFLGLCMSIAARLKQKTLFSKLFVVWLVKTVWCIITAVLKFLWRCIKAVGKGIIAVCRSIPQIWGTFVVAVVLLAADFISVVTLRSGTSVVGFLIRLAVAFAAVYGAFQLRKLQLAGRALAAGDLSYHVDTEYMVSDIKEHGENLNNIASGMNIAVEERLKSERMKTELITNVSHDLKTPLTSIISYSELINNEDTENEKIKEYSEVLLRQSQRLKRLIEDLVEASKASTGNLDVAPVLCDPAVFIQQAGGEYEDRIKAAGLELILKLPDENVSIMADGRRMQRIFDNLLSNVCKYSQSGTRVYMSLDVIASKALITIKNTSAAQLNISGDELMERFVRGDSSRNTEGSGLGLSIAKSLTELQGGTLSVSVDGDLFKVILSFPVAA